MPWKPHRYGTGGLRLLTYADSGFVVSLYLTTEGTSAQARKEVKRAGKPIFLSPLSLLEIRNALNFGINRGEITSEQCDAVLAEIDSQIETGFFRLVDASQSSIYAKAQELSNKHTPAVATRSSDLMHLAAALLSGALTFLTFDKL
ncbi:MAG: PIN domain-containing protein [Spartobacteria bacterium]|nr:PIN domain-containing protein [Spartobacteria bacterium]